MTTPSVAKKHKNLQSDLVKLDEKIRHRAYDLYEQWGRRIGHELDDWLQAEAEVTGNKRKKRASHV